MNLKLLTWRLLRLPLVRRVVLRALMLLLAVTVVSLMRMGREDRVIGLIRPGVDASAFDSGSNLTEAVFKALMEKNLLQSNARALCVGPNSANAVLALRHLGFFNVFGVNKHPYFSLIKWRFVYELDFDDCHFDFAFVEDLDRASARSLLVLEIERVLRPSGTGAILPGPTLAASFLQSSDVVHECHVGSFKVEVFKKRLENFASFEHFRLPSNCPSFRRNEPYLKFIEPLSNKFSSHFAPQPSYLSKFMNISSRNKLIYINLGAGEYAKASIGRMSKPYCSDHHSSFEVFIIDHKTSVLSTYITNPGINFIYDPALAGGAAPPDITSDEFLSAPVDDESFDFVRWFKETVSDGDFVVLMMKAKSVEVNILVEMFKTGAVCYVDELFLLGCYGECMNLLESLRKSGVYVHQWFGD